MAAGTEAQSDGLGPGTKKHTVFFFHSFSGPAFQQDIYFKFIVSLQVNLLLPDLIPQFLVADLEVAKHGFTRGHHQHFFGHCFPPDGSNHSCRSSKYPKSWFRASEWAASQP